MKSFTYISKHQYWTLLTKASTQRKNLLQTWFLGKLVKLYTKQINQFMATTKLTPFWIADKDYQKLMNLAHKEEGK